MPSRQRHLGLLIGGRCLRALHNSNGRTNIPIASPRQRFDPPLAAWLFAQRAAHSCDLDGEVAFLNNESAPRGLNERVLGEDDTGCSTRTRSRATARRPRLRLLCLGTEPPSPDPAERSKLVACRHRYFGPIQQDFRAFQRCFMNSDPPERNVRPRSALNFEGART
jgi:hypothetical protein